MIDIPNTEYITINKDGVFVGGEPATTYRGVKIYNINYVKNTFAVIQERNPNITELHVLSSETSGGYGMVGNPSPEHGSNAWCRVKMKGGTVGGWVFYDAYTSAANCARYFAYDCANRVRADAAFRRAGLVTAFDKKNWRNCVTKWIRLRIEKLQR